MHVVSNLGLALSTPLAVVAAQLLFKEPSSLGFFAAVSAGVAVAVSEEVEVGASFRLAHHRR